eukprot:scaffold53263_cov28-Tisochrysis_lutea.AAC.1
MSVVLARTLVLSVAKSAVMVIDERPLPHELAKCKEVQRVASLRLSSYVVWGRENATPQHLASG